MNLKSILLALTFMASTAIWAQQTDGLIVTMGDAEQQFVISEVKQLTFSDKGLAVVKTDEAVVEFAADWQIRFGEVTTTGISFTNTFSTSNTDSKAKIYNAEGKLIGECPLSDLHIGEMPKGVYIVKFNGKSLKIKR